jgi:hypothetical protein
MASLKQAIITFQLSPKTGTFPPQVAAPPLPGAGENAVDFCVDSWSKLTIQ